MIAAPPFDNGTVQVRRIWPDRFVGAAANDRGAAGAVGGQVGGRVGAPTCWLKSPIRKIWLTPTGMISLSPAGNNTTPGGTPTQLTRSACSPVLVTTQVLLTHAEVKLATGTGVVVDVVVDVDDDVVVVVDGTVVVVVVVVVDGTVVVVVVDVER